MRALRDARVAEHYAHRVTLTMKMYVEQIQKMWYDLQTANERAKSRAGTARIVIVSVAPEQGGQPDGLNALAALRYALPVSATDGAAAIGGGTTVDAGTTTVVVGVEVGGGGGVTGD